MGLQNFKFSIVTAAFNAGKWIDAYFQSIVNQAGGFSDIQLIFVDDGSTDSTLEAARKWADKYPQNIFCCHKENGGPASARNHGLEHATGEWITFIDPDDFVCESYFDTVRRFIHSSGFDGNLIACNLILFDEKTNQYWNHHPLSFKFNDGDKIVALSVNPEFVQLSSASCFIRAEVLKKHNLMFDERIKPSFEDAHFLNKFLIQSRNYKIGILCDALYFYRKRILADGLVASGWSRAEKYKDKIFYGYLGLLTYAKNELGAIPEFLQNVVVYAAHWHMNRLLEQRIPYEFKDAEFSGFLDLMRMVFRHIDADKIFFTKLPMLSLRTRIAMLNTFKNIDLPLVPFQVLEVSPDKQSMLVARYSGSFKKCRFMENNSEILPLFEKQMEKRFMGRLLCAEQLFWLPLDKHLVISVDGKPVPVLSGDELLDFTNQENICNTFYTPVSCLPEQSQKLMDKAKQPEVAAKYEKCWLLSDRADLADDNAEHLYRWVLNNAPSQNAYFVIKRQSPDWDRLEREGFRLIAQGSEEHHLAVCNAEWVISSHLHHPVMDPLGVRRVVGCPEYKFAFLQHGITKDDISNWVNRMKIDLFVCATRKEYDSLLNGQSIYTSRELVLTGFPRHDALLAKRASIPKSKLILVCPTWRDHLCNPHTHSEPGKDEANAFVESDYYKAWNALTSSAELSDIAKKYGYRFLFLPHPYSSRVVHLFEYSERFTCKKYSEIRSVQDLLCSASMLITEYSSMAMEAAMIGMPVIHYQFPEVPSIFSTHTYTKGYFEYERDGFGPVVPDIYRLSAELEKSMAAGCARGQVYEERAEEFFTLKDGNNCLRTYQALIEKSDGNLSYEHHACIPDQAQNKEKYLEEVNNAARP